MSTEPTRILLADDDAIIRQGLANLLSNQENLEVVAAVSNGAQVFDVLAKQRIDIALLDVDMPVSNGIETAKRISQDYPTVKSLMLTAFESKDSLAQAIGSGICGFLTKDTPLPELVALIRQAYRGQIVMSPKPTELMMVSYKESQQAREKYADFIHSVESLPDYLRPTFDLLIKALANKNISRKLHLSESTVRSYVSEILMRTGTATRAELAITAIKAGIQ